MVKHSSSGALTTTMRGVPGRPSLTPPGANTRGNSSKGFTKPCDCGPTDLPVVFDETIKGHGANNTHPAKMNSPMGPATGVPGRVRKTR